MEEQSNNAVNSDNNEDEIKSLKSLKRDSANWGESAKTFMQEIFDIRSNTDRKTTIEHIKQDIPFKGHTAWILICSIFIASIGLNANSTAVVIGAMLISPLMGPILGMGMGIAINDIDTLQRSMKNFAVMVVLSVVTAFTFFYIFPLKEESSELLARTAPDVRDVLIAFFGGLALIIARTKEGTIASVIFGVAIATALMPPLCTAGYGLAIGNFKYFLGAMYLFVINTIFIALATYLILKLLRFPLVKYANQKRRKLTVRIISAIAILVMIPAIWTFYNVFQKSLFFRQAEDFVKQEVMPTELENSARFMDELTEYEYDRANNISSIEMIFMGEEGVTPEMIKTWNKKKEEYIKLKETELIIVQGRKQEEVENHEYVVELYENIKAESKSKDEVIRNLKAELEKNIVNQEQKPVLDDFHQKAFASYPEFSEIRYNESLRFLPDGSVDTIYELTPTWKADIEEKSKSDIMEKFLAWATLEINNGKVKIVNRDQE